VGENATHQAPHWNKRKKLSVSRPKGEEKKKKKPEQDGSGSEKSSDSVRGVDRNRKRRVDLSNPGTPGRIGRVLAPFETSRGSGQVLPFWQSRVSCTLKLRVVSGRGAQRPSFRKSFRSPSARETRPDRKKGTRSSKTTGGYVRRKSGRQNKLHERERGPKEAKKKNSMAARQNGLTRARKSPRTSPASPVWGEGPKQVRKIKRAPPRAGETPSNAPLSTATGEDRIGERRKGVPGDLRGGTGVHSTRVRLKCSQKGSFPGASGGRDQSGNRLGVGKLKGARNSLDLVRPLGGFEKGESLTCSEQL